MIYELVNDCIENKTEHGIGKTTLQELSRNLHEFSDYCQQNPITVEQIISDFMPRYGTHLLAVHWSIGFL